MYKCDADTKDLEDLKENKQLKGERRTLLLHMYQGKQDKSQEKRKRI